MVKVETKLQRKRNIVCLYW